jgi:putative transposase
MIAYIDQHRDRYGVEPICQLLPIAPSTYYDAKRGLPSARALRDQELKVEIRRVHQENFGSMAPARCGDSCAARAWPWPAARSSG